MRAMQAFEATAARLCALGRACHARVRVRAFLEEHPEEARDDVARLGAEHASSGSVLAQRLIFGYSTAGDLTPHIEAHFDTTTGPKCDAPSYRRIAQALRLPPAAVLFLSDVSAELDAAREARMQTGLCVRDGAAPDSSHAALHTFDDVFAQ
jgi:2,3-diketo-5-methylthio-1-phosphopentane phosphatase